jgi:uncharacterized membrane protein
MARRYLLILILFAGLLAGFFGQISPAAAQSETDKTVNAVLFWSNGCPHCETVLLDELPSIQQKYGDQLNMLLVELVTLEDVEKLYELGARLGLSKEQVAVPLLLIGETALVGAEQIPAELPGLVDQQLASGGIGMSGVPEMGNLLESGVAFTEFDPSRLLTTESHATSGIGLAWAIMALMLLSLVATGVAIVRAFQGKALNEPKGWLAWALPVLAVIGLGIALYMTYVEGSQAQAICGPIGDCNTVQSSRYAKIFEVIPVGLFGALGYIGILAAWLWRRTHKDALAEMAAPALFGMTAFGVLYSIYLTYLEIFVIHAVCIWCLSSAVIMTLLMLLSLGGVTRWLAAMDEEE